MKKVKEGLNQYIIKDHIQNVYFKNVEYEMIHQNDVDIFLTMHLRQRDDNYSLLYDVTAMKTLEEVTENKGLLFEDCTRLLKSFHSLLCTVEEYMLQIEHVNLAKNRIYLMKDGSYKMYYSPDENFDVEKDAEELFAWLLSRLDYRDQRGVQFLYHAYDLIRNRGLSLQMLEQAMDYKGEFEDDSWRRQCVRKEEEATFDERKSVHDNKSVKKNKKSESHISGILWGIGSVCIILLIGFCIMYLYML